MSAYRYAVLGCGRQGLASAYDLARFGNSDALLLIDADRARAERAASWLNAHLGESNLALTPMPIDGSDPVALTRALEGCDAAVSALPYQLNLIALKACLEARTHFCDMGGHTGILLQQLALDAHAKTASIAAVPDCGQAPGMATSLMVLALRSIDQPEWMEVWDAGLPLEPQPPLGYRLLFSVQGLTNEYDGPCRNIRDGQVVELASLSERQRVEFPAPFGTLEAFCASGTASTFPDSFAGAPLQRFTSRIMRYPGHLDAILLLKELGFFSEETVLINDLPVVPRRVTESLLERALDPGENPVRDAVLVRIHVGGRHDGIETTVAFDCQVHFDPHTDLTAMQRCTGFDAAIVAAMLARGEVAPGVHKRELAIDPFRYRDELTKRDIVVTQRSIAT
ncbi:MAG: saccharopine dehydrogenase C-terminal domain-containing protein [Acidobacteriota bacterium]